MPSDARATDFSAAVLLPWGCIVGHSVVWKVQSGIFRGLGTFHTWVRGLTCALLLGGCTAGLIASPGSDGNGGTDPGDDPPDASAPPADSAVPAPDANVPLPDSGTPDTGVVDDVFLTDPLNNCTSGMFSAANSGLEMQPGQPCITCHLQMPNTGPVFSIAGTVYPTGHEASGCNGVGNGTAVIRVTDASGTLLFDLQPNAVGTFASLSEVPAGFRVKVVTATGERAMLQSPPHGDCNACHTPYGAGTPTAPGRIRMP